jgi:fucose 4-O-acetylase-like acetyltransferase
MGKERIVWADALRGLLILLVVLGHSLQFGDFENRLCWNIIYSFHMAAFFVVSGYVSYKDNYKLSSLKHKAQQLLLPFVSWSILMVLIKDYDWNFLVNVIMKPDGSYWFIYVLFMIIGLFTLIQAPPKNTYKPINYKDTCLLLTISFLILVMVITEFRLFGFQFFALYFGFYVYGYWIRKFSIKFNTIWIVSLGVLWFSLALFWRMHEVPAPLAKISFIPASLLTYSYRYITAIIGSLFFISFAMKFMNKENLVNNYLCYLGKISLGIYIIHLFIGRYVSNIFESIFNSDVSILFVMCDFTTKLILSLILIHLIKGIPIVRLLLLGKK